MLLFSIHVVHLTLCSNSRLRLKHNSFLAPYSRPDTVPNMNLETIKAEVRQLTTEQRQELAIYLVHLELVDDAEYFENLRSRMNKQLAQSWEDLDDL